MKWRFGVLGCGHIGRKHIELSARYGELTAIADIDHKVFDYQVDNPELLIFQDSDLFLGSGLPMDIVVIATPNGYHAEQSIRAMEAGYHVICEKPMAISADDARNMVKVSIATNQKLFVVKQNRFNKPVQLLKLLLEKNAMGRIHQFQLNCFWNRPAAYFSQAPWRGTLSLDGGPLFTQFSHFIDLLIWLLGDIRRIDFCRGHRYKTDSTLEFEDAGEIFLELENGASGTIQYTLNTTGKNMEGSISLFGEKGTIKVGGPYLNRIDHFAVEGLQKPDIPENISANEYGFYQGSGSHHDLVYEAVLEDLGGNEQQPILDLSGSVKTVEAISAIYKIMRSPENNDHGPS